MATIAQIAANRLNALSSTGPTSEQGKQASSRNALSHGLYASLDSLPAAERAQFDEIYSHFAADYPQPAAEPHLHELALAWFRRERVRSLESAFFEVHVQLGRQENATAEPRHLMVLAAIADANNAYLLNKFHRWERSLSRDIERAQKALSEIAKTKPIPQPAADQNHAEPAPQSLNSPCRCGSGLKYKRSCEPVDRRIAEFQRQNPILAPVGQ